jgi:hypothetical protein
MAEHGTETFTIAQQQKVQKKTILMLKGFQDSQGPVLEHYQVRGTIISNDHYIEMLTKRLKPAIQSKC